MATTTNPMLIQGSELFLSEEFHTMALIEMPMKAAVCPSIIHDSVRVEE